MSNMKHLTAMTFNLRMDTAADGDDAWPHRKEAVVQTIETHQPVVLGTQEGLHHMIEFLETSLTDYGRIGQGREGGEEGEYSAIFYRKDQLQLIEDGQFWLSETPDIPNSISWDSACPRVCTWGKFQTKDAAQTTVVVYNTHLDHVSQLAREKGMALIGSDMETYRTQETPIILMGDFNCEPDNPVIQALKQLDLSVAPNKGRTFHGFKGGTEGSPIDFIFVSQSITRIQSFIERQTVNNKYPSDHYPVIDKLEITQ